MPEHSDVLVHLLQHELLLCFLAHGLGECLCEQAGAMGLLVREGVRAAGGKRPVRRESAQGKPEGKSGCIELEGLFPVVEIQSRHGALRVPGAFRRS
jgi:hypothetical protein